MMTRNSDRVKDRKHVRRILWNAWKQMFFWSGGRERQGGREIFARFSNEQVRVCVCESMRRRLSISSHACWLLSWPTVPSKFSLLVPFPLGPAASNVEGLTNLRSGICILSRFFSFLSLSFSKCSALNTLQFYFDFWSCDHGSVYMTMCNTFLTSINVGHRSDQLSEWPWRTEASRLIISYGFGFQDVSQPSSRAGWISKNAIWIDIGQWSY